MVRKSIRSFFIISLLAVLFSVIDATGSVHALTDSPNNIDVPVLESFIAHVTNGQPGEVRGIYIPEILAAPVVQQPAGKDEFVSPRQNIVTQFSLASRLGSTGLLAHNYLAGEKFALLQKGQGLYLIKGDGQISTFVVAEILRYQASAPASTSSTFVDMEDGDILTYSELFRTVYNRPGRVIFQTCIDLDGNRAGGRLFIIAEPSLQ